MNKLFASLVVLAGLLTSTLISASELTIDDAWIREAPPISKVQAAYMELHNDSNKDISLISASSPHFSRIEFHRTEMSNGVMRMLQEKTLTIPARGETHLQPDGAHMMLFNPRQPLKAEDQVPFTLTFSNQKKIKIVIVVKKATSTSHHHGHHE